MRSNSIVGKNNKRKQDKIFLKITAPEMLRHVKSRATAIKVRRLMFNPNATY